MTTKAKILVPLAVIAAVVMGYDLYLGLMHKSYGPPVIAAKAIIVVVCFAYAVKNIFGTKTKD